LGIDLTAAGSYEPRPLPVAEPTASVDGYEVQLDGRLSAGADGELRFSVRRDGRAVQDLEPYLGAYGHLVAIRAADHAYLHVHPTQDASPRQIAFAVATPSPGAYRLFLDFQHEGTVRHAAFTVDVAAAGGPPAVGEVSPLEEGDDGQH
jgi:hypothetical protein